MNDKINELLERVEAFKPKAAAEIEDFRIRMLGKKGELTALMEEFKSVAPELKREFGQKLNNLKNRTQERINALRGQLADAAGDSSQRIPDMSRPGSAEELGSRHPISLVTNQIVEVFSRLGYTVAEGPEIEDDWHVFSSLNFAEDHPASPFPISKSIPFSTCNVPKLLVIPLNSIIVTIFLSHTLPSNIQTRQAYNSLFRLWISCSFHHPPK